MDLNVIREGIVVSETIFEGSIEQPVDLDFVLPDYCPDITRILKCVIIPQINIKQILGDRLNVEGTALIRVCYVSQSGHIRAYENSAPFSNSFSLKFNPEDCLSDVTANVEYVNCRATSQRRLDVHAAIVLSAHLTAKGSVDVTSGLVEDSIEAKTKNISYDNVIAMAQQSFSISETVELGKDKPDVKQILRTEARLIASEYKAIANKIILKADAILKVIYLTDTDPENIDTMEYIIPVSQIIDIAGIDESSMCSLRLDTAYSSITVDSDTMSDTCRFNADIRAIATVYAYEQAETPILLDAYSTKGLLVPEFGTKTLYSFIQCINENHICKGNLPLRDTGVDSVADIWFECQRGMSANFNDGKLTISGKINVCMIALNQENEYLYLERTAEYEYSKRISSDEDIACKDIDAAPVSIGYRMNTSGELELQAEIRICASVYKQHYIRCIDSAILNEDAGKNRDSLPSVVVYYANQGEELWNIAREHYTCVKEIQEENNLSADVMESNEVLIIPI